MNFRGVIGFFSRWFGPQREAGQLIRDAETIVEAAKSASSNSKIREVALRIRDELEVAHARGSDDPSRYAPLVHHFRRQHSEARRRRDDAALTVLTLVIIYLRAETIGTDAEAARDHIDAFISEWTQI